MSYARQDTMEKASTVGQNFYAYAGGVINTDAYFIATERVHVSRMMKLSCSLSY